MGTGNDHVTPGHVQTTTLMGFFHGVGAVSMYSNCSSAGGLARGGIRVVYSKSCG